MTALVSSTILAHVTVQGDLDWNPVRPVIQCLRRGSYWYTWHCRITWPESTFLVARCCLPMSIADVLCQSWPPVYTWLAIALRFLTAISLRMISRIALCSNLEVREHIRLSPWGLVKKSDILVAFCALPVQVLATVWYIISRLVKQPCVPCAGFVLRVHVKRLVRLAPSIFATLNIQEPQRSRRIGNLPPLLCGTRAT